MKDLQGFLQHIRKLLDHQNASLYEAARDRDRLLAKVRKLEKEIQDLKAKYEPDR